jgi:protein phosphatase 2C family protein 2/3
VFDGHGGTDAVCFVRKNILKFIIEDGDFPNSMEKAITSAFLKADHAIADSHSLDRNSGTTALTAIISGRYVTKFWYQYLKSFIFTDTWAF